MTARAMPRRYSRSRTSSPVAVDQHGPATGPPERHVDRLTHGRRDVQQAAGLQRSQRRAAPLGPQLRRAAVHRVDRQVHLDPQVVQRPQEPTRSRRRLGAVSVADESELAAGQHGRPPERPRVVAGRLAEVGRHRYGQRDRPGDPRQHGQLAVLQLDRDLPAREAEEHVADEQHRVVPAGGDRAHRRAPQRRELRPDQDRRASLVDRLGGLPGPGHASSVRRPGRTSSAIRRTTSGPASPCPTRSSAGWSGCMRTTSVKPIST